MTHSPGESLTAPMVSEAEMTFYFYKKGTAGGGMTALIDAIFRLDTKNRAKIALGFPELVEVINRYNFELGYWEDLQQRIIDFHSKSKSK